MHAVPRSAQLQHLSQHVRLNKLPRNIAHASGGASGTFISRLHKFLLTLCREPPISSPCAPKIIQFTYRICPYVIGTRIDKTGRYSVKLIQQSRRTPVRFRRVHLHCSEVNTGFTEGKNSLSFRAAVTRPEFSKTCHKAVQSGRDTLEAPPAQASDHLARRNTRESVPARITLHIRRIPGLWTLLVHRCPTSSALCESSWVTAT